MKYTRDGHVLVATGDDGAVHRLDAVSLTKQRAAVLAQRDRELLARTAELAEIDELLGHCERLGIPLNGERADRAPKSLLKRIWAFVTKPRGLI